MDARGQGARHRWPFFLLAPTRTLEVQPHRVLIAVRAGLKARAGESPPIVYPGASFILLNQAGLGSHLGPVYPGASLCSNHLLLLGLSRRPAATNIAR